MFTDRFIKLPITVYNLQAEEMGLDDLDEWEVSVRLDPLQIESYNEARKDGKIVISVCMKSGDEFAVYLSIRDFEKRLNEFERGAEQREFVNVNTHEHSKLNNI